MTDSLISHRLGSMLEDGSGAQVPTKPADVFHLQGATEAASSHPRSASSKGASSFVDVRLSAVSLAVRSAISLAS